MGSGAALNDNEMNDGEMESEEDRQNKMEEGRETPSSQQELIPQDEQQSDHQISTQLRD